MTIKSLTLNFFATVSAAVFACVLVVAPVQAGHACPPMSGIDANHDGKLDIWEVKRAARRTFKKLNPDGDRTLERDELRGRMGPKAFAAANRIKRRGIDAVEYDIYVTNQFRRINGDGDRTLECPEVCTRRGMRLIRLLK